jgi:hypothetical protein
MNGISSIRLTPDCDAAISRHAQKLFPQTVRNPAHGFTRAARKGNRLCAARRTAQTKTMKTNLPTLAVRRRQLQHSADGEYPHTDPANAGMRRKFDLPPDRPLNP